LPSKIKAESEAKAGVAVEVAVGAGAVGVGRGEVATGVGGEELRDIAIAGMGVRVGVGTAAWVGTGVAGMAAAEYSGREVKKTIMPALSKATPTKIITGEIHSGRR
jgi:hypothetical protein